MHNNDAVGLDDFPAMSKDNWIKVGVGLQLGGGKKRRELFLAQIVERGLVAVEPKLLRRRTGDG